MDSQPRVALVTGCGGSIGWSTVNNLLREGWIVLGLTRQRKTLESTRGPCPQNLFLFELDARSATSEDFHSKLSLLVSAWEKFPRIQLVVNIAAICPKNWDAFTLLETFSVNVVFPQRLYEVFHYLDMRHYPEPCSVINVSSGDGELCFFNSYWRRAIEQLESYDELTDFMHAVVERVDQAGLQPYAVVHGDEPAYRLSKALLNRLTLLQARTAPSHIRIDAICPGDVKSNMNPLRGQREPSAAAKDILQLAELQHRIVRERCSSRYPHFWRLGKPIPF
jgi:NAD(P)-dependent dehydrogenase (short-subunit alcohol dehydrogenase family)